MNVYRLARQKYADDLSGEGAKLFGGRWNSKGNPMLYTSSTRSLAILEVLVNADKRFLPKDMVMLILQLDPIAIHVSTNIPDNWREVPFQRSSQKWGDSWLSKSELAVSVPSIVVPQEHNVLVNPLALNFDNHVKMMTIESFSFDARLFNEID
jgi:RES domain-containing protein